MLASIFDLAAICNIPLSCSPLHQSCSRVQPAVKLSQRFRGICMPDSQMESYLDPLVKPESRTRPSIHQEYRNSWNYSHHTPKHSNLPLCRKPHLMTEIALVRQYPKANHASVHMFARSMSTGAVPASSPACRQPTPPSSGNPHRS